MNPSEIGTIWELDGIEYIILDQLTPIHSDALGTIVMYSYKPVDDDKYRRHHHVCESYEFMHKFKRVEECPLSSYVIPPKEEISSTTIVTLAKEMALKAHGDQAYGEFPYSKHLEEVVALCKHYNLGYDAEALAWLHDVVEDTETTEEEIQIVFGERMSLAVRAISNESTFHATARSIAINPLARIVKMCDRLVNMRNSVEYKHKGPRKKYIKQYSEFRAALHSWVDKKVMWSDLDQAYKNLLEGDDNEKTDI